MRLTREEEFWKALGRVGMILPLTPWPVLVYINHQPDYGGGNCPHGCSALYAVGDYGILANLVMSAAGLYCVLASSQTRVVKSIAAWAIVIHFFIMTYYIFGNAVAYV